jgi:hypothetical protein
MKLLRRIGRFLSRDKADAVQAAATMAGRPDIAAGIQVVEDAVDVVKGKKRRR